MQVLIKSETVGHKERESKLVSAIKLLPLELRSDLKPIHIPGSSDVPGFEPRAKRFL